MSSRMTLGQVYVNHGIGIWVSRQAECKQWYGMCTYQMPLNDYSPLISVKHNLYIQQSDLIKHLNKFMIV